MRPVGVASWLVGVFVLAASTLTFLSPTLPALADAQADPVSPTQLSIHRGLMRVDVRDVPLVDLLRAIGERSDLRVSLHGPLTNLITRSFAGVALDEAIRRLVGGHGLVLLYAPARGGMGLSVLTEVRVYDSPLAATMSQGTDPTKLVAGPTRPLDSDRDTRLKAVQALARRRDGAALAALAQTLALDEDPTVRAQAAAALGSIRGSEATAALSDALGDQDPAVRIQAVRTFGRIEGDRAIPTLGNVLLGDPDPHVRRETAHALGGLQTQEAWRVLEAAAADPDKAVRHAATSALAKWARRPATPQETTGADHF